MRSGDLAYWINERWRMYERYVAGTPPYSSDSNMSQPRYCNVHRENDRVTKWIAANWRDKNVHAPHFVPAMVLARLVNWTPTLALLGYPYQWGPEYIARAINIIKTTPGKVWTSAYTISTCGEKIAKEEYVLRLVDAVVKKEQQLSFEGYTLEDAHDTLMEVRGLGSFLAAQVIADLKNTPGHPLKDAPDWFTWAAPGPGSLRGLEALYGRPVKEREFTPLIRMAYEHVMPLVSKDVPPIHMQDFQNCLCEFSKYMRIKEGDKRVRNKYTAWGN